MYSSNQMVGRKFNKLTIIELLDRDKYGKRNCSSKCDYSRIYRKQKVEDLFSEYNASR